MSNEQTVAEIACGALGRLHRIEIARLKLELARERYNHAGLQIDYWQRRLKAAEKESETGIACE